MTAPGGDSHCGNSPFNVAHLRADLAQLLDFGPRATKDTVALKSAIGFIESTLQAAGYTVCVEQFGPGAGDCNLLAERVGSDADAPVFELGAHFDTVENSPGADDNGSGIVGVLGVARHFAVKQLRRTLRFCFFGQEESGLLGSKAHQRWLDADPRPHAGCMVFEMIGCRQVSTHTQRSPVRIPGLFWPPRSGDFIAVVANWRSRQLAGVYEQAAASLRAPLKTYSVKYLSAVLKDAVRSDHSPYWDAGRRALMLTDTAGFRNQHYHQPTDTIDTIDFEFLSAVASATAVTLERYAS